VLLEHPKGPQLVRLGLKVLDRHSKGTDRLHKVMDLHHKVDHRAMDRRPKGMDHRHKVLVDKGMARRCHQG
jgi:hypothetical protein